MASAEHPGGLLDERGRALDFLRVRRSDYIECFSTPAGQRVLADLGAFCRAAETVWADDARLHAALTGRHEVWLRIQQHLQLGATELFRIFTGQPWTQPTTTED